MSILGLWAKTFARSKIKSIFTTIISPACKTKFLFIGFLFFVVEQNITVHFLQFSLVVVQLYKKVKRGIPLREFTSQTSFPMRNLEN